MTKKQRQLRGKVIEVMMQFRYKRAVELMNPTTRNKRGRVLRHPKHLNRFAEANAIIELVRAYG